MAYTVFLEKNMTTQDKVDGMNDLEDQYDDAIAYMNAMAHAIYTEGEADARYYKTASHVGGRSDTGHGCGINASKLDGFALADIQAGALPRGAIGMFGIGSIPGQYAECNGLLNTPDLRNYFLRGAGAGILPGATGGQNSVTPTAANFASPDHTLTTDELPIHRHEFYDNYNNNVPAGSGTGGHQATTANRNTISTNEETGDNEPHNHSGCSFSWTGYKDQNNVSRAGALDNRPPYIAVRFIMVR